MVLCSEELAVTPVYELLIAPWRRGNEQFHQLLDVLVLCRDGIARTPHVARYAEEWDKFCVKFEVEVKEGAKASLEYLQTLAAKATTELTLGFPTLHAHVTVSLWSIVENTLEDFVVEWIKFDPQVMNTAPVPKIKISLAEYMILDEDERARYVLNEIKQHLGCGSARGIEKFEKLLNFCGIGGPVDDDVRKNMLELSEMRNAIVHRGSSADRKLLQACPWLRFKPKEKIAIDHAMCDRYVGAVDSYMGNAMTRVGTKIIELKKSDPHSAQENN
jgi:hypothetical protein